MSKIDEKIEAIEKELREIKSRLKRYEEHLADPRFAEHHQYLNDAYDILLDEAIDLNKELKALLDGKEEYEMMMAGHFHPTRVAAAAA